jgi:hypothetical protein
MVNKKKDTKTYCQVEKPEKSKKNQIIRLSITRFALPSLRGMEPG